MKDKKKDVHIFINEELYYKALGLFERYRVTSVQKLIIKLLELEIKK